MLIKLTTVLDTEVAQYQYGVKCEPNHIINSPYIMYTFLQRNNFAQNGSEPLMVNPL